MCAKKQVYVCVCVCEASLSLWAGTGPKRVLTRLMGFHTLKYTHVHTFGHTIMLKINMSESYVWSQTNKHTHPHMHTLWYKRICQAPTLYTCKTNGLQKSTQPSHHSLISKIHSFTHQQTCSCITDTHFPFYVCPESVLHHFTVVSVTPYSAGGDQQQQIF